MEQQAVGSQRKDVSLESSASQEGDIYVFPLPAFESLPAWLILEEIFEMGFER